jgi:adenylate cyclase
MSGERVERRLTAILVMDVAEYSRLMEEDEEGTHERLKAHFAELINPKLGQHRGRTVKNTGDGILAEFASVVDAVRCAVEIQRAMTNRNLGISKHKCIAFRIGINISDVIVEPEDIFGDGVNVAARLESLAAPGGICVSARVQEVLAGRFDLAFEDIGEQSLKNITRKVRVYRIRFDKGADIATVVPAASLALPDKPSVAVLPFANISSDPEQEFLADGIAEDIITALSRYPSLFVIARNSTFTYKDRAVEVRQVGRDLGVRYVLEGSLRKSGNRIRVTALLVEAETGKDVWAERYDRDLADIFLVQDEISEKVTTAVAPAVAAAELRRAMRKPPGSLDAWTAHQRGLWHLGKFTAEDNALAQMFFKQAIDLDPNFAGGYWGLSAAYASAADHFQTILLQEAQKLGEPLARRAVALDPGDAEACTLLGAFFMMRGDCDAALTETERALAMTPNLANAHGQKGASLMFLGRPGEGIECLRTCIRLGPRDRIVPMRLSHLALGFYLARDYSAAAETAPMVIRSHPDFPWSYRTLAAALGQLGRGGEAAQALAKLTALAPALFEAYTRNRPPWFRPEDHAHLLEGLRKAGWGG